ncbi:transmembrane signal receptor [Lithospermum erythrorhizon]|uniref:Transmembrane signal receptor n=1 Tax=Lithospermum erythrorhizon TaxID=34254 RepID=A0AAV3QL05_LITER
MSHNAYSDTMIDETNNDHIPVNTEHHEDNAETEAESQTADNEVDVQNEEQDLQEVRRSSKIITVSSRYFPNEYVLLSDAGEPICYQEAIESAEKDKWIATMEEEMHPLHKNKTFTLVKRKDEFKILRNRWIYKLKSDPSTNVPRYKARLVVKGFVRRQGIDFEEMFSLVVKMTSIRLVLGLAAAHDLEIEQLDVKTAFLHGDLEEDIYMQQPEGFEVKNKETLVCKLQKSLANQNPTNSPFG